MLSNPFSNRVSSITQKPRCQARFLYVLRDFAKRLYPFISSVYYKSDHQTQNCRYKPSQADREEGQISICKLKQSSGVKYGNCTFWKCGDKI